MNFHFVFEEIIYFVTKNVRKIEKKKLKMTEYARMGLFMTRFY